MKSIDHSFYAREAWKQVRLAYLKKKRFICERCGGIAKVVHHRVHLNADNIHDDTLCYGESNLEALCVECHNREHHSERKIKTRFTWTADGKCLTNPPTSPHNF